jgi:hypothetical protein
MALSAFVVLVGICLHYKDTSLAGARVQSYHFPNMLVLLFKFASYAFLAFAGAAFFVIVRHRFRQQHLWKIPGPSNPSVVWGKIHASGTMRNIY